MFDARCAPSLSFRSLCLWFSHKLETTGEDLSSRDRIVGLKRDVRRRVRAALDLLRLLGRMNIGAGAAASSIRRQLMNDLHTRRRKESNTASESRLGSMLPHPRNLARMLQPSGFLRTSAARLDVRCQEQNLTLSPPARNSVGKCSSRRGKNREHRDT